jgi:NAD(P)-dependent dehydrogenase (short-subunit alcohol dehydrogenase family)
MNLRLQGRRVLITGASQGIGEAIARAFAAEGAELFLVARTQEKLRSIAAELESLYAIKVHVLAQDLTAAGGVDALVKFGASADVLVNNAGDIPAGSLLEVDDIRWRRGWELKVFGYINITRAIYSRMKARGRGVILNNIGSSGESYDFGYVAGSTGNAALMAFTRAVGSRSLEHGIRVLGINPGPVATPRFERVVREAAGAQTLESGGPDPLLSKLPLGRAATVGEVADLFVFLASPRSAYSSGAIVTVDGGMSSRGGIR